MTKQTQMYVGVGVVAIAGYFLWKSTQTKKGFMYASGGSNVVTRGGKVVGKAMAAPVGTCKCSPNANANTLNGQTVYECCAAGKYGNNPGPIGCGCGGGGTKDKDFVGNNSKVFKGDKSFVGDNSKVFKGDNFVGDNSRVFKGDM